MHLLLGDPRRDGGHGWRQKLPQCLCLLAVLLLGCEGGQADSPGEPDAFAGPPPILELNEVRAIPLPLTLPVAGVDGRSPDTLFLWNRQGISRLDIRWGQLHPFQETDADLRPEAVAVSERGVEVLDAARRSILLFSEGGEELSRHTLPVRGEILGAERATCGWFVVSRNLPEGDPLLHLLGPSGEVLRGEQIPAFPQNPRLSQNLVLDRGEDGVLLSGAGIPFSVRRVDCGGEEPIRFEDPIVQLASEIEGGVLDRMFTVSTLALGGWYLQTLADPASDLRALVLYDEAGGVRRVRTLESPMGFALSFPNDRTLVGLRQLEPQEVVLYRWTLAEGRWTAGR
jgi:hypothetical protein